ncbi:hypothetical protein J6590_069788 [Homalodisca vitripennis]|nr:hypothetical protein J6590_069788 [Homalodisca vitripennis]
MKWPAIVVEPAAAPVRPAPPPPIPPRGAHTGVPLPGLTSQISLPETPTSPPPQETEKKLSRDPSPNNIAESLVGKLPETNDPVMRTSIEMSRKQDEIGRKKMRPDENKMMLDENKMST